MVGQNGRRPTLAPQPPAHEHDALRFLFETTCRRGLQEADAADVVPDVDAVLARLRQELAGLLA
jgi:hypothetical protein